MVLLKAVQWLMRNLLPRLSKDQYIMKAFVLCGILRADIYIWNKCRMFLQVITLSDSVNANQDTIASWVWNSVAKFWCHAHLVWPRQLLSLPPKLWKIWRCNLPKCFGQDNAVTAQLGMDLGNWLSVASDCSYWTWLYSLDKSRLYWRMGDSFEVWTNNNLRVCSLWFSFQSMVAQLPDNLVSATSGNVGNSVVMTGTVSHNNQSLEPEFTTCLKCICKRLYCENWVAYGVESSDDFFIF